MSDPEITTRELTVEGRVFVVQKKREVVVDSINGGKDVVHSYSLDNGATWHTAMTDAYTTAKTSGLLTEMGEPITEGGEFEAFLLGLVEKITAMDPGERLILVKTESQIVVLQESTVLAVRASTISDVDLKMSEGK